MMPRPSRCEQCAREFGPALVHHARGRCLRCYQRARRSRNLIELLPLDPQSGYGPEQEPAAIPGTDPHDPWLTTAVTQLSEVLDGS